VVDGGKILKLIRSCMAFTPEQILLGYKNWEGKSGQDMWHVCGSWWMCAWCWYGNVSERESMVDLENLFCVRIMRNTFCINTVESALGYCTVFSVLLWVWQSVCSSYCSQLNAVSLVCYCECGCQSVPVTAVSWMLSV
jgi:hypothetical protein